MDKVLGLDEFSMASYQSCCNIITGNIINFFQQFFLNGVVGKSLNSTFITLIPKKDNSIRVRDLDPSVW